ncbi:MAG: Omp28 family outer membrane lipoprotein [Bacteroidales bacterium]|nr:Omp28 family outer membrane lipoprotein [Bacteroidales bacterium]MDZ4204248.1 Omp28 family outer membrane lipoprotein [Bacteroidales bacterium]
MKQRILFIVLLLVGLFIQQSCDKIELPYVVATNVPVDPGGNVIKKVLIEEFTGHQCPNCPRGAVAVEQIKQTYGSRIVVMSVHAGLFARTSSTGYFTMDYRAVSGTELDNFFGVSEVSLPKGMVNRAGFNINHRLGPDDLAGVVANALEGTAVMDVKITNNYNAALLTAQIKVEVKALASLTRKLMLSIFIVEDSIVSPQKNSYPDLGPDVIINYVHRHVLRAAVNGTWGEVLHSGNNELPAQTLYTKIYDYTIKNTWNANNIGVVAFVYDGDTYEVVQAAEKHL